jgi:hypothetical protein
MARWDAELTQQHWRNLEGPAASNLAAPEGPATSKAEESRAAREVYPDLRPAEQRVVPEEADSPVVEADPVADQEAEDLAVAADPVDAGADPEDAAARRPARRA